MSQLHKRRECWSNCIAAMLLAGLLSTSWGANRFVAPLHVSAMDEGSGDVNRPYKTIAFAMTQLMPGDTLNIAAGTYREAILFPKRAWSADKPTIVTGTGEVTLLGTELVGGWQLIGDDIYVKRPWILEPQQVIVNGTMLKQIGGSIFRGYPVQRSHELASLHRSQGGIWPKRIEGNRDALPPESFIFDDGKNELVIRTTDKSIIANGVEIAMRPYLVQGQNVAGITISNIHFRYSNTTTMSRQGAVTLIGQRNTLDKLIVEDMDGAGIEVSGDLNTVRNSVITRSGYLGVKARGKQVTIDNNDVTYNNTRRFNKWWEAGGMKFVGEGGLQNSTVTNNRVHHNFGDGIWFDWGNDANVIEKNTVAFNEGFGIQYEASSGALIQDNMVFGNGQRGIYVIHSRDSIVLHNLVAANGMEGIAIVDEQRADPKGLLDLRPVRNKVFANLLAWNKGLAVILPGPEYKNSSDGNLYVFDKIEPLFSMGWPRSPLSKQKLTTWRKDYVQDMSSMALAIGPGSQLQVNLDDGITTPNWGPLLQVQSKFKVPTNELQSALPAGVAINSRSGPR